MPDDAVVPDPDALRRVRAAAATAAVRLHPDAETFLSLVVDSPYLDTCTTAENRAAIAEALPLAGTGAELAEVRDAQVDGPGGPVPVRVSPADHGAERARCDVRARRRLGDL